MKKSKLKICKKCFTKKSIDLFDRDKSKRDGHRDLCKKCKKIAALLYNRTKEGIVTKIYSHQKLRSDRRGHPHPTYSKEELRDWLFSQPLFHILYDNWKRLDYQTYYKPSVDRIDNDIGYTMANIQLMTWKENEKKEYKPVTQMTLDGKIIKSFESVLEASRKTKVNSSSIYRCCYGEQNCTAKNKWKFQGGDDYL